MGKSISSNKKELEKRKQNKRLEKQKRKEERKTQSHSNSLDDMIAYVDENGVITSTPPDLSMKKEIEAENIEISTPKNTEKEQTVFNGYVEYFNQDKGFGFIKNSGSVEKYFFHISNAPASIKEGNKVTFELEHGKKGLNAVSITLANKVSE